jgi:hypothetical protein
MEDILNLTADEIRAKLVEGGVDEAEVKDIKGKTALRERLSEFNASQKEFTVTETTDGRLVVCPQATEEKEGPKEEVVPKYLSAEWHNYVMSKFTEDELCKGQKEGDVMPRLFGLRRLVNDLIGDIVNNKINIVSSPNNDNQYSATVVSKIGVVFPNGTYKLYSDVADCSARNTSFPYNLHLTSTAASKAESRNLRKILGLRGIIAAEEFVNATPEQQLTSENDFINPTAITDAQIEAIDLTAKAAKINVMKYINKNENERYNSIKDVPFDRAKDMLATLMKFRNKVEGFTVVPSEIAGYDPNWNLTEKTE